MSKSNYRNLRKSHLPSNKKDKRSDSQQDTVERELEKIEGRLMVENISTLTLLNLRKRHGR